MSASLTLRLQKLEQKAVQRKQEAKPFPLSTFLQLVLTAGDTALFPWCEGARLIHDWLTDNGTIPLAIPADTPQVQVPRLAHNYFIAELARIVHGKPNAMPNLLRLQQINTAIYIYLYKHTIQAAS